MAYCVFTNCLSILGSGITPYTSLDSRSGCGMTTSVGQAAFFGSSDNVGPLGVTIQHICGNGVCRVDFTSTRYGVSGNDLSLNVDSVDPNTVGGLYIKYQGNVGIGTSNPSLHNGRGFVVRGTGADKRGIIELHDGCTTRNGKSVFQQVEGDTYIGQLSRGTGEGRVYFLTGGDGANATVSMTILCAGNVGIGTTSPQSALHVTNTVAVSPSNPGFHAGIDSNGYASIQLTGCASLGSYIDFSCASTDFLGRILYDTTNNYMSFGVCQAERMRITNSGNVGIGTTSPNEKLQVAGAIAATGTATTSFASSATMDWFSTGARFISRGANTTTAGTFTFSIESSNSSVTSNAMVISNTGNVGIGTNSPGAIFHVSGSGDVLMRAQSSGASSTAASYYLTAVGGVAKRYYAGINVSSANGAFEVYDDTCASSRLLVSSVGNVGIGTTAPQSSLHVAGTLAQNPTCTGVHIGIDAGGYAGIQLTGGTTQGAYIDFSCTGTDGPGRIIYYNSSNSMEFTVCGGSRMTIVCNGNIGIATATPSYKLHVNGTFYAAGSSIKYKEGICNYDTDSCLFMCLKPVTYQYKDEWQHLGRELKSQSQIGLIAEDVAQVMPELAILVNEEDEKVVRNVDYEKLSVVLLKEVQKLRLEVDQLKNNK